MPAWFRYSATALIICVVGGLIAIDYKTAASGFDLIKHAIVFFILLIGFMIASLKRERKNIVAMIKTPFILSCFVFF